MCVLSPSTQPPSTVRLQEDDQKLLAGQAPAAAAGEGQPAAAAAPELTGDQRLALGFRMDKKQLLLAALAAISQQAKTLAEQAAAAGGSGGAAGGSGGKGGKKGQPPKAKTGKGFGA